MSKHESLCPEEFLRQPLYYGLVTPSVLSEQFFTDTKYSLVRDVLQFAMHCGSPSLARQTLANVLHALYNNYPQSKDELGCTDAQYCDCVSVLECFLTANALCTRADLESMKPCRGVQGRRDVLRYYPEKYEPYPELLELARGYQQRGITIGLVQGFFDPVHLGHTRLFGEAYPFCDVLMVGVSKDSHARVKRVEEPRYPLAARIAEITVSPAVGHVFILPVEAIDDEKGYRRIWSDLGINVVTCGIEHPILEIFQERMRAVNEVSQQHGRVIPVKRGYDDFSSSKLQLKYDQGRWGQPGNMSFHKWLLRDQQRITALQAIEGGILRDYPNGT